MIMVYESHDIVLRMKISNIIMFIAYILSCCASEGRGFAA